LLFVALSVRTLRLRRTLKIGIGTGENETMLRAMRVHSNFAEYAPIALLLALMVELGEGNVILIHLICISLLAGRLIHAYGVSQVKENYNFRVTGMALTFTSITVSAACLLYMAVTGNM